MLLINNIGARSFEGLRTSSYGCTEMKIGPIRVQLGQGDLTKESTEVIVNSVGANLELGGKIHSIIRMKVHLCW